MTEQNGDGNGQSVRLLPSNQRPRPPVANPSHCRRRAACGRPATFPGRADPGEKLQEPMVPADEHESAASRSV